MNNVWSVEQLNDDWVIFSKQLVIYHHSLVIISADYTTWSILECSVTSNLLRKIVLINRILKQLLDNLGSLFCNFLSSDILLQDYGPGFEAHQQLQMNFPVLNSWSKFISFPVFRVLFEYRKLSATKRKGLNDSCWYMSSTHELMWCLHKIRKSLATQNNIKIIVSHLKMYLLDCSELRMKNYCCSFKVSHQVCQLV